MGRFGIAEDEPIENSMVSRALESAQTKIEGFNFDSRKHVLEFDNVLDRQRKAVYDRRRKVLVGTLDDVEDVLKELATDPSSASGELNQAAETVLKKEGEFGREAFLGAARTIILQTIDMLWMEHLESMEYLRGSVNLRAYGQRDPLTEYRKEGTRMYRELEYMLAERVFQVLDGLNAETIQPPAPIPTITLDAGEARSTVSASVSGSATDSAAHSVGRNDKVTITNGTETREMKFKKAEPLLTQGWRIVEK